MVNVVRASDADDGDGGGIRWDPTGGDEGRRRGRGGDVGIRDADLREVELDVTRECVGGVAAGGGIAAGAVVKGIDEDRAGEAGGAEGLRGGVDAAFDGFEIAFSGEEAFELEIEVVVTGEAEGFGFDAATGTALAAIRDEEGFVSAQDGAEGAAGAIGRDIDGGACRGIGSGGGELDVGIVHLDDEVTGAGGEAGEAAAEIEIGHAPGAEGGEGGGLGELFVIGLARDAGDGFSLKTLAFLETEGRGGGGVEGEGGDIPSFFGAVFSAVEFEEGAGIEDAFAGELVHPARPLGLAAGRDDAHATVIGWDAADGIGAGAFVPVGDFIGMLPLGVIHELAALETERGLAVGDVGGGERHRNEE